VAGGIQDKFLGHFFQSHNFLQGCEYLISCFNDVTCYYHTFYIVSMWQNIVGWKKYPHNYNQ
jgi:hypothetical protein